MASDPAAEGIRCDGPIGHEEESSAMAPQAVGPVANVDRVVYQPSPHPVTEDPGDVDGGILVAVDVLDPAGRVEAPARSPADSGSDGTMTSPAPQRTKVS